MDAPARQLPPARPDPAARDRNRLIDQLAALELDHLRPDLQRLAAALARVLASAHPPPDPRLPTQDSNS